MSDFLPIREVSSYTKNWTIRGRVTSKSDIRQFAKAGGGKVFNVTVLDESGAEIRANFFNAAADQLYPKLERGRCYTFSRGTARVANQQYNSTGHKYELVFDKTWQVENATEDVQIGTFTFNCAELSTLRSRALPCKVDICGVIVDASSCQAFTTKDGVELTRRELTVADASGHSINATIWGERAKQADEKFRNNPVVALKYVLVKEWNGALNGSHLQEGELVFSPDIPEAMKVQQWWQQGGSSQSLVALSTPMNQGEGGGGSGSKIIPLLDLREEVTKVSHLQVYIIFCRLHSVQMSRAGEPMPLYYSACQESKNNGAYICNKRVDDMGFCAVCNRIVKHEPKLAMRMHFSDAMDSNWIGTFHDPAVQILGFDAEEAAAKQASAGREALEAYVKDQYYSQPLQIMVRAKREVFNGQARINVGVMDACPVDLGERGRDLLQEVKEMLAE